MVNLCAESAVCTFVFCFKIYGGELLAVFGNSQPDQFSYIILLGQSFNVGVHRLRFAGLGTVVILTGSVRNILLNNKLHFQFKPNLVLLAFLSIKNRFVSKVEKKCSDVAYQTNTYESISICSIMIYNQPTDNRTYHRAKHNYH